MKLRKGFGITQNPGEQPQMKVLEVWEEDRVTTRVITPRRRDKKKRNNSRQKARDKETFSFIICTFLEHEGSTLCLLVSSVLHH